MDDGTCNRWGRPSQDCGGRPVGGRQCFQGHIVWSLFLDSQVGLLDWQLKLLYVCSSVEKSEMEMSQYIDCFGPRAMLDIYIIIHSFIHSFNVPVLGTGITAVNQTDKSPCPWASLVAQWLRIHLPMQGTRVRSLVREDPTCHGATKSVHHNY